MPGNVAHTKFAIIKMWDKNKLEIRHNKIILEYDHWSIYWSLTAKITV